MKLSSLTRTRKGRVALAAVPTAIAVTVLMGGVANGAIPVSFAVSGVEFQVGASHLEGTGFSQYSGLATEKGFDGTAATAKKAHPVALTNIHEASLTNLCQSVVQSTPLGTLGLKITAGDAGEDATAEDMQISMSDMKGDATFTKIRIGVDASTVNTADKGSASDFAQDADGISVDNLQQKAYSVTAGTFTLKHLHLALTGGDTCFK